MNKSGWAFSNTVLQFGMNMESATKISSKILIALNPCRHYTRFLDLIDFLCCCFAMLRSVSLLLDPGFRKPTRDAMLCAKQGCNKFLRTPSRMMPYFPVFAIIYQVSKKRSSDCFTVCATKFQ